MKLIMKKQRKFLELEAENKRLKKVINEFGNNPAGFDWAVLEKIENLEEALALANSMILSGEKHSKKSKSIIEQALKV